MHQDLENHAISKMFSPCPAKLARFGVVNHPWANPEILFVALRLIIDRGVRLDLVRYVWLRQVRQHDLQGILFEIEPFSLESKDMSSVT